MKVFSLKKEERLSKKKLIQELFEKGSSFYLYPLRVVFLPTNSKQNQILISVSKTNFKRAVDRNTIKRRIREGYRLNKHALSSDIFFSIAYIYTAREIVDSSIIHQKIIQSFNEITERK
ncbi:MAG: ribonuclease P protein component [Bacteroidetes bacterium]|nr:ribonuclease P protein component [Bacteroidota bacterium]